MSAPPCRKRFQIHLTTAIVMMFVAGGLIWANVHEDRILPGLFTNEPMKIFGWPTTCVTVHSAFSMRTDHDVFEVSYKQMGVNCAIAVSLLFNVYCVCEWWIGRRAARKAQGSTEQSTAPRQPAAGNLK